MTNEQRGETISFDDKQIVIRREPTHELYLALQPPDAAPYMVAPLDTPPEELVGFVEHHQDAIRELRTCMIKRFENSKSPQCHYKTGDVAYLFGRPFMLRVFPAATKKRVKGTRTRSDVGAAIRPDVSVIDLFVLRVGDFDQGRSAFLSFAKPIYTQNVTNLVHESMERTFPGEPLPRAIRARPMRDTWVHIDDKKDVVWFSEGLIPYPADCVVYAFLMELIKQRRPEASEEEVRALLDTGVPGWQRCKDILNDSESPYSRQ